MITIKRPKDNLAEWVQGISSEAYHADKHIVSSTSLKSILKSPASFLTAMTEVKPDTEAFRFGRMFHMALLEPKEFDEQYIIQPDFGDLRTKAGKDKKADWVNANLCAGAEAMTQDEAIKIKAMVDSVMDHRDSFMLAGMKEVSGYYTDPVTGISCKIRPDCFHQSLNVLIDVKTTQNCAMDEFSKEIANRLYHFQMAMYCEGIQLITGRKVDHAMYVVVEKNAPYECAFYELDDTTLEIGKELYRRALDTLATCLDTNTWSKYQNDYQTISLPIWAIKKGLL